MTQRGADAGGSGTNGNALTIVVRKREGSGEGRRVEAWLTVELLVARRLLAGHFVLLGGRLVVFFVLGGFDGVCGERGGGVERLSRRGGGSFYRGFQTFPPKKMALWINL